MVSKSSKHTLSAFIREFIKQNSDTTSLHNKQASILALLNSVSNHGVTPITVLIPTWTSVNFIDHPARSLGSEERMCWFVTVVGFVA
jgi:hypothetical protein